VVATLAELTVSAVEAIRSRIADRDTPISSRVSPPGEGGVRGDGQGITNMLGQAGNSARPSSSGPAYPAMVPPGPPPLTPRGLPLPSSPPIGEECSQGGEKARAKIGMNSELVQNCRFITPPPGPPSERGGEFIALLQDWSAIDAVTWFGVLALGFNFLAHHDTEFGNRTLLIALSVGLFVAYLGRERGKRGELAAWNLGWMTRRLRGAFIVAWVVPLAALLAAAVPLDNPVSRQCLVQSLINRCRFAAVPADDIERLALWCRDHTPSSARFIGPPGPKTFRLWSLRSLAFNRAASPYNAAGLADWFSRFQEHVNFHSSPAEFVCAYLADRHGFESRYQAQTDAERAELAIRQGAKYIVAAAPNSGDHSTDPGPLELLHIEGHYAVYQVRLPRLTHELLTGRQQRRSY
jgi:hypothetical protein